MLGLKLFQFGKQLDEHYDLPRSSTLNGNPDYLK